MDNDPSSSVNVTGITDAQLAAMQQAGLLGGQSGLGTQAPSVDEMQYATQVASPQYQTNYPTPAPSPSVLDSLPTLDEAANYLANLPAQAQRLLTNPAAFTEMLTGKNPLPEQTGFAASATGLPPQNPNSLFTPAGMAYNKGYESGEPVSIAAMGVPALAPAGRFLGQAAGERIMAGKSLIPGTNTDFLNPQIMSAVKNKGGNWIDSSLSAFDQFKKPIREESYLNQIRNDILDGVQQPESLQTALRGNAQNGVINNWIDSKLKKYVKNEMGTPTDPVRELADQGITHLQNIEDVNPNYAPSMEDVKVQRAAANMPLQGFASAPLGKHWENLTDQAIRNRSAGMRVKQGESTTAFPQMKRALEENPWLKTVEPTTPVHDANGFVNDLEFRHLIDELKNSIAHNSDLPAHLRLKPETLDKMTVPHAVKHVAKINKYRAEQVANAAKEHLKDFPIVHEGGNGYNIHELKLPEVGPEYKFEKIEGNKNHYWKITDPEGNVHAATGTTEENARRQFARSSTGGNFDKLDKALKNEGEQMGHCVGGYTDSVADGKSRIFSLRDEKGGAHATVEATPSRQTYNPALIPDDVKARIDKKAHDETVKAGYPKDSMGWLHHYTGVQIQEGEKYFKNNPLINIQQIKGKGNGAVSEKYRGYIKDWLNKEADKIGEVQDLDNVGLFRGTSVLNDSLHKGGTFKNIVNQQRPNSVLPNEEFAKQFGKKFYSSPEELAQDVIKYLDSKKPFAKTPAQMREELFAKSRADEAARKANEPRTLEQRMRDQGRLPPEGHKNGGRIQKFAEGGTPDPIYPEDIQKGLDENRITKNQADYLHNARLNPVPEHWGDHMSYQDRYNESLEPKPEYVAPTNEEIRVQEFLNKQDPMRQPKVDMNREQLRQHAFQTENPATFRSNPARVGSGAGGGGGGFGGDGLLKNEISAKNPVYKNGGSVKIPSIDEMRLTILRNK